jgi:uncharacterized membrane protein HdeD (DUF308 family)
MEKTIINKWWMPVLLGVALFLVSILIMSQPMNAFIGFSMVFGWFILFNGVMNIIFAAQNRKVFDDWIWYLLLGIFEVIIGGALLFQPQMSAEALLLFAGFWMMFVAVSRISTAFLFKKLDFPFWWLSLISGILIFIFSFLILINPLIGALSIVYLIAIPLMIYGAIAIYFGLEIRRFNKL